MDPLKTLTNCKVFSTVTQEEDQEAWLKNRTTGIGGSDIGAICGVSHFSTARQIYLGKTGQFKDSVSSDSSERMHFGHVLEPVVADEYARRSGKKLITASATLIHKDYPWARANVDRLIVDDDGVPYGVLECKTTGEYNNDDWDEGDIPESYVYQLNWYLWITGLKYGAFACLVGGNKFYHYDVYRDDELIEKMRVSGEDFWNNNVLKLKEPELQAGDTDLVDDTFVEVKKNSEVFFEDDITNDLAFAVFSGKQKIKELEDAVEEAKNRLKEKIGNNEFAYCRDFVIKWSPRSTTRVDQDKLKTDYPDIYNVCRKTTASRAFYVKGAKV